MIAWKSASLDPRIASFRFRVEKPLAALKERGHEAELFQVEALNDYSAVVFSKSYSAEDLRMAQSVKERGGKVIFDLCDNHFYNPAELPRYARARREMLTMMKLAHRVTCSTPALAAVIGEVTEGRISPLVISDIAERAPSAAPGDHASPFNLLWFGSHGSPNAPSGMADLLLIRKLLEDLARETPLRLTVCSNSRAKFNEIVAPFQMPTRYVEWSIPHQAAEFIEADAVVLPVTLNPFTACKTHNRLSSALYAGRPVVATAIDSYREFAPFCSLDDWNEGLRRCIADPGGEAARAALARPYIDERYSAGAIAPNWEAALDLAVPKVTKRRRRPAGTSKYLGRVDAVASGAVTGWVQNLLAPGEIVEVVLECDGETIASAKADLPRGDLRNVHMPHPDCGFAVPLHDIGIADPASLKIKVATTGWLVGENPILLLGDHAEETPPVNAPPPPRAPIAPEREQDSTSSPLSATQQRHLLEEVQAVEALVMELRRVMSRAVVGLGDDPAMAERLRLALATKAGGLKEEHAGASSRAPSSDEAESADQEAQR